MSKYGGRDINVNGDGNAIGNNNRVTVVKNEKHHHHHRPTGGGGSGGGPDIDGSVLFGLAIALIAACVLVTFEFAKYAPTIYAALQALSAVEIVGILVLIIQPLVSQEETGESSFDPKTFVMLLLSSVASVALFAAHSNYRDELTTIAQSAAGAKAFWCGLNDFGRQFALFHAVTATFGFGVGNLLLAVPIVTMAIDRYVLADERSVSWELLDRLTSWPMICLAVVPIVAAAYMHTDSGWSTWTNVFSQPPSMFCPTQASGHR